jgi:lysozyme
MATVSKLQQMLLEHEGLRLKPYRCPAGRLTIGVGHNLDDNGITHEIAMLLLRQDIDNTLDELHTAFPWMVNINIVRRDALADMAFNLGMPRFRQFKKMLKALSIGDYLEAHHQMLDSKWAGQVGKRARELAQMILTGEYP